MANANLLNANQAYVDQQNFDVGGEIVTQFGNVMNSYNNFKIKLNEDATTEAENLNADAIGVDLMSGGAQDWFIKETDRVGMEIAKARASGNKNLVRKLETEGADLIAMQSELGNLLKDHAENKLSGNYSTSADTDMLDLLITGKKDNTYTLKRDSEGRVRVFFTPAVDKNLTAGSSLTDPNLTNNKFTDKERQQEYDKELVKLESLKVGATGLKLDEINEKIKALKGKGYAVNWQKEGVLLSDLDKHIRLKDDGQSDMYNSLLKEIGTQAGKDGDFNAIKDKTQKIIKQTTGTTDQIQTALFDDSFLQNGITLSELWAKELEEGKLSDQFIDINGDPNNPLYLNPNEELVWKHARHDFNPNQFLKSNGKYYKRYEKQLKEWMQGKLMTAAQNHHTNNEPTYGQLTDSEKKNKNTVNKINDFLAIENPTPNSMLMLGNATTKIEMAIDEASGVESYLIKKWSNGTWVDFQSIRRDTPFGVTKRVFQNALGVQEESK